MARPKKKAQEKSIQEKPAAAEPAKAQVQEKPADDCSLPKKDLFRIDEVAAYFGVTEQCIRLWIEHGHLKKEKIVGIARIPRYSILECRFRNAESG